MIRHSIFLISSILFFSCGRKNNKSDLEIWNSNMLRNQSEEIKKAYYLLDQNINDGHEFKLSGIYSSLIDTEMKDLPKSPHIVFFFYEINEKELMAHFYVDSVDVINLGSNVSRENFEDYDKLKALVFNTVSNENKATLRTFFIDPMGFKSIESNFRDWARHMPSVGRWDTLNSNQPINIKIYNEKYLPKGHEIIGKQITVGNENEEIFYIIYKVRNSYYLKLVNYLGQIKYQRKIYDENFIKLDNDNFSRYYLSDRHVNFENCKKTKEGILIVQKDSIGIVDLYDKSK